MSRRLLGPLAGLLLLLPTLAVAAGAPVPPLPTPTGTWRWLQPKPSGANLRDVTFADSRIGFAAGSGSTILRTRDGGNTWEVRPTPNGQDLVAISAVGTTVIAGGGQATLLRSQDGGDSFTQAGWPTSATRPAIVDVQLVDANNGFALADDGSIGATTDGFRTLAVRGRVTFLRPRALWFTSATKGWIVGDGPNGGGVVALTIDGGRSFSQAFAGTTSFLTVTGISFGGVSVVVACGSGTPRAEVLDESKPNQGWQPVDLPFGEITAFSIMVGAPGNKAEFWAAAGDGMWGVRDGDQNVQRPVAQTRPRIWSVASPSVGTVYGVGEGGTIIRGVYGGGTGITIAGNHQESFTAASFPTADGQFGALADNQPGVPRLWLTTTGGATLTTGTNATARISAMSFVDAQNGFGVLDNGEFYATTNGGTAWTRRSTVTFGPKALAFVDTQHGYAAGDQGLYATSDGGVTWQPTLPNVANFVGISVNGTQAAAATSSGEVYQRTGAQFGGNWVQIATNGRGITNNSIATFTDGRVAVAGRNASGPAIAIYSATGQTLLANPGRLPKSLAISNNRLFVLLEGGGLGEVLADGSVTNTFESKSDIKGLASRTVASAAGTPQAGTVAFGDFGALLVFDDQTTTIPNQPPQVFPAVPSITLAFGQGAQLDVKAFDPEGSPLTYRWSDPNNAGLAFGSPDRPSTQVKWAAPPQPGTKAVARVTVCDTQGACSTADIFITVPGGGGANRPPVAVASGVNVTPGGLIFLDGSGSADPDGDQLTWTWTQLSGAPAQVQGPSTLAILAATAPATTGTLTFELKVCDPQNACGRIEVTVVVANATQNQPPVAQTKGDLTVAPGAGFALDASDSFDKEDGKAASVAWRQVSGPTRPITGATLVVAKASAGADGEVYRFVVRVCDTQNACSEAAMNVTVKGTTPTNLPPKLSVPQPALTAKVGDRVTLSAVAVDPEGEAVKVSWKDEQPALGLGLAASGPNDAAFVVPPSAAGQSLKFTVTACDPQGACSTATATVTVAIVPGILANAGADQKVASGAQVTLDGSGSTGPIASLAWSQVSGTAVALTGADTPKPTFTAPAVAATLVFRLTVTGADGKTNTDDVQVEVTGPTAPIANAGPDQRVGYGARVQLDGRRTQDSLGRTLTYAWKGPDTVTLTGADTPVATFYAPATDARLPFTLTVCAGADLCTTDDAVVIVEQNGNLPPIPDAGADLRAQGGSTIVLDGTRSLDPEGGRLTPTWTLAGGDGAEIAAAGALWTQVKLPDAPADVTLVFELSVCDEQHSCATDTVKVTVLANGPEAPSIRAGIVGHDDGFVDEQADFDVRLEVTCPAAPCADQGQLRLLAGPPLARVGTTGWTFHAPAVSRPLPFSFEASVCDVRGHCAAVNVPGLVRDTLNEPPVPLAGPDQEVHRREVVVLDGSATYDPNGDALTVRWKQASGGFQVALGADGLLRPRFTVPADAPLGPATFELTACDVRGACATGTATITVIPGEPANRTPIAEAGDDQKGPLGAPLHLDGSRSFDPDGDVLTYRWKVVGDGAGQLVDGDKAQATLVLSAATPADAPLTLELEVCDAYGGCATDSVHVTAWEPPADTSTWDVHFGETTRACGCAGEPGSVLALLGLAGLLARRRAR